MVPNIFVSSTIADLHHVRDGLREAILDLGYNPILSEYGDVGFLPSTSAIDSCYVAMRDCQIAVIVLGKRYGSLDSNGLSVSHNEFRTAREHTVPIVTLVERDVLAFNQVYEANADVTQRFPGMDAPKQTFGLLAEIKASSVNNGILPFMTVTDARLQVKRQIAHFVGDLLRRHVDPVRAQLRDVLSELKTLRHDLHHAPPDPESVRFLRATRFLLGDPKRGATLAQVSEQIAGTVDAAVPIMLKSTTLEEFIREAGYLPEVVEKIDAVAFSRSGEASFSATFWASDGPEVPIPPPIGTIVITNDKRVKLDTIAYDWLQGALQDFHEFVDGQAKLTHTLRRTVKEK